MAEQTTDIEGFEGLPLRFAYVFLSENGLAEDATEIKRSKDRLGSHTSSLRRGKVVDLLEKNNLLDLFKVSRRSSTVKRQARVKFSNIIASSMNRIELTKKGTLNGYYLHRLHATQTSE